MDDFGRRVYTQPSGVFLVIVEGKPGVNGQPPGGRLEDPPSPLPPILPDGRPDLQLEVSHALGNGDPMVMCTIPNVDGVPSIEPPDFGPDMLPQKDISSALRDMGCRFSTFDPANPCTLSSNGNPAPGDPFAGPTIQYCSSRLGFGQAFPQGDTVITVRLRDLANTLGPPAQVVVHVGPP